MYTYNIHIYIYIYMYVCIHIYIYMYPGTRRAVDERFINGATAALRSWLLSGGPSPYCLCKPFSCKACSFCLFIQLVERACKTKVVVMVTCIYIYIYIVIIIIHMIIVVILAMLCIAL